MIVPTLLLAAAAAPIDAARWRDRLLLVFAPAADAPDLVRQRAVEGPDSRARDLRVVIVAGGEVTGASDTAAALRRRFGVGTSEFRAVLVGKDGGVKLDERAPIPADRLFAAIDAMPMRRDEMKQPRSARDHSSPVKSH